VPIGWVTWSTWDETIGIDTGVTGVTTWTGLANDIGVG
jgi:hypothetical protein